MIVVVPKNTSGNESCMNVSGRSFVNLPLKGNKLRPDPTCVPAIDHIIKVLLQQSIKLCLRTTIGRYHVFLPVEIHTITSGIPRCLDRISTQLLKQTIDGTEGPIDK